MDSRSIRLGGVMLGGDVRLVLPLPGLLISSASSRFEIRVKTLVHELRTWCRPHLRLIHAVPLLILCDIPPPAPSRRMYLMVRVPRARRRVPPLRGRRAADGRTTLALAANIAHAASAGRGGLVSLAPAGLSNEAVQQSGLLLVGDDVGAVAKGETGVARTAPARMGHLEKRSARDQMRLIFIGPAIRNEKCDMAREPSD